MLDYFFKINVYECTIIVKHFAEAGMLTDLHGNNVSVTEAYLTTDSKLVAGVLMERLGLAVSGGIKPTNTSKLLKRWMDSRFSRQVDEVSQTVW